VTLKLNPRPFASGSSKLKCDINVATASRLVDATERCQNLFGFWLVSETVKRSFSEN
jgi:hypothetical protein